MSSSFTPFDFMLVNAARLPLFIVYIVGFVLALTSWPRHPRASLLSLISFTLFFLANVAAAVLAWYAPSMRSSREAGFLLVAANFIVTTLTVVAWCLILFALFGRRPWQPDRSTDVREQFPHQYSERDAPLGPASQDIRK